MPTIVHLSSSPPRIFARSPTRVDFSSPPRSSEPKSSEVSDLLLSCATSRYSRDGFVNGCTSPRKVLGDKVGAENALSTRVPKNAQFKKDLSEQNISIPHRSPKFINHAYKRIPPQEEAQSVALIDSIEDSECLIVKVLPSDLKKNKKQAKKAPKNTTKLPARRTDWTPPRYATVWDESPESRQLAFGDQLVQFNHVEEDSSFEKLANSVDGEFTKRRRIDLIETKIDPPRLELNARAGDVKKNIKSRSKSPTKKPLTITGLATSNYLGQETEKSTPMMQYLVSTQAKMGEDQSCNTFETKMKKRAVAKGKMSKFRSRLRSPQTAMQTLDSQELIFASASQLARDDEPSKSYKMDEILDTPNKHLMSDPYPTQQTTVASIESSTPKTGTSRYRAHRGLWSVADRDDDNALLHLHDEFDTPFLKEAFAGKDALFEQAISITPNDSSEVFDISEVATPVLINSAKAFPSVTKRTYSSLSKLPSSKRTKSPAPSKIDHAQVSSEPINVEAPILSHQSIPIPERPDYASWSDKDLKQQLKTFGIKGMRKRENMVKRLDMLWASANGVEHTAAKSLPKAMQQGDFLSKVHDFTQRPAPRTKRPKTTRFKAKVTSQGLKEQESSDRLKGRKTDDTQSEEKSRKMVEENASLDKEGEEALRCSVDEDVRTDYEGIEPSTAPMRGTGVKASAMTKARSKVRLKVESRSQPLTPPPTMPPETISLSSPGFEDLTSVTSVEIASLPRSGQPLKSKILLALKQVNANGEVRNHQINPTWWEKIQMYDPIVLEDFTTWLNTEGLGAVGEDGEIDANEVKAWCEEVGVCCLWKGGWRGNKVNKPGD